MVWAILLVVVFVGLVVATIDYGAKRERTFAEEMDALGTAVRTAKSMLGDSEAENEGRVS